MSNARSAAMALAMSIAAAACSSGATAPDDAARIEGLMKEAKTARTERARVETELSARINELETELQHNGRSTRASATPVACAAPVPEKPPACPVAAAAPAPAAPAKSPDVEALKAKIAALEADAKSKGAGPAVLKVTMGGVTGGTVSAAAFKAAGLPAATHPKLGACAADSYTLSYRPKKRDAITMQIGTGGAAFDAAQRLIDVASSGDVYVLSAFKARCPGGKDLTPAPAALGFEIE